MKKLFLLLNICTFLPLSAQSPYPFGTTPMSDMEMTEYNLDKDAPAVYLLDWCKAELTVGEDFKINVERHFRIKILKEEGLDYASVRLQLGNKSSFTKFRASTFNLEDGKMVESPLNKKEIYKDKSGGTNLLSFAFTNVKTGSVIECSYTTSIDFVHILYPWSFQNSIPVVYSEYNAVYPGVFRYKIDGHYDNITVNFSRSDKNITIGNISTKELSYKWTASNVPAFKPEPYMASENDLLSRVEFELDGLDLPNKYEEITPSYEKLTQKLMEDENFGGPLNKSGFLTKKVQEITSGLTDNIAITKAIHQYITQNIKWNEETGIYTTYAGFKKNLQQQSGSAADINLLFVAMLQKAGITACPVVLSTRENGVLSPYYAILSKFDYVVAYAKIGKKEYLMDATDEYRPFDELPPQCLSGNGRTIHPRMSKWIPLQNNEQFYDQVIIDADLNSNHELVCQVQRIYASYSAYNMRKLLQTTGKDGFIAYLKLSGNNEYSDVEIKNQDSIGKSLIINYKVTLRGAVQSTPDLSIINPVLFFAKTENPFTTSERKYPIDFPCATNEVYTLNIKTPKNYTLDELPAELSLKLEKNGAVFFYLASAEKNVVTIKYRYQRKETHFAAENYKGLKEFYNQLIKKQSDLIILKKNDTIVTNL